MLRGKGGDENEEREEQSHGKARQRKGGGKRGRRLGRTKRDVTGRSHR